MEIIILLENSQNNKPDASNILVFVKKRLNFLNLYF